MNEASVPGRAVDRALVAHAALMTLLGLLSGFSPVFARAPRAALAAHTIGMLQGALLFGLAAIWPALGARRVVSAARYCTLVGLYANWLGAQLAGLWSARAMFLVHGAAMPKGAAPWMEALVAVLLNLSLLLVVACALVLYALWRPGRR